MNTFHKTNTSAFRDHLRREAEGLALLREAFSRIECRIAVPEVIAVNDTELILPRIEVRPSTPKLMSVLGEGLALLHRHKHDHYGFGHNNYIGLSPQINQWTDDWGIFFRDDRLGFQVSRIRDTRVRTEFESVLTAHGGSLADFLNEHCDQPSLLHGDLWSGNALFDSQQAWLIDPAVYYGDRESDLAMTEFFGGFSTEFYIAYSGVWPLSVHYQRKRDIYNLYHALNHYNLFGSSYLGRCRALLAACVPMNG